MIVDRQGPLVPGAEDVRAVGIVARRLCSIDVHEERLVDIARAAIEYLLTTPRAIPETMGLPSWFSEYV